MEILAVKLASALALPPGVNFLVAIAGLALMRRARRAGLTLIAVSVLALWILTLPVVSYALERSVQDTEAVSVDDPRVRAAQVIVVLTGGRTLAPEYGHETVSTSTLERIRYAAWLHRATGAPLLLSGGTVFESEDKAPESVLARQVLEEEFGVPVRWIETASRNTGENARESARILREEGLDRVVLVTNSSHMTRAVRAFARAGMAVTPAPVDLAGEEIEWGNALNWLPSATALSHCAAVLHELIGRIWYGIRY